MQLDDQLLRYFGTTDLAQITPAAAAAAKERIAVDLGLEQDRSRRFALWVLLYSLGAAPALDIVFEREEDRNAARNFMDMSSDI